MILYANTESLEEFPSVTNFCNWSGDHKPEEGKGKVCPLFSGLGTTQQSTQRTRCSASAVQSLRQPEILLWPLLQ